MISAGKGGHIEIVKLFLDRGANDFNFCAEKASLKGYLNIVKLMLDKGATNLDTMFLSACKKGHIDIVKFLLGRGFLYGLKPAIKCAAFCGHLEVVQLVIDAGFPVSDITSVILSATI